MKSNNFEEIATSTKTITILSNLFFKNMQELFECFEIDDFIHYLKLGQNIKGKRKEKKKKEIHFHNTITVDLKHKKLLNFKISSNGTFQLTGCQKTFDGIECLHILWDKYIYPKCKTIEYNKKELFDTNEYFQILIIPCMKNITSNIGYQIDKKKLIDLIKTNKEFEKFIVLSDDFFENYSGINIKNLIPQEKLWSLPLKKITIVNNILMETTISYKQYLDSFPEKIKKIKIKKQKFNTFLFFYSGSFIMSGMCSFIMKEIYSELIFLLKKFEKEIKF